MNLKILSWNIWYDNDSTLVCDFLASSDADIIGLQEIVPNDPTRDIGNFLKEQGYHEMIVPSKTLKDGRLMSNAVFSKYPIINTKTHILSTTDSRTAVQADIEINRRILHVFSTHLLHTHQAQLEVQNEQAKTLISLVPEENSIVTGDFNATPDSFIVKTMKSRLQGNTENTPTLNPVLFDCKVCDQATIPQTRLDYIFTTPDLKTDSFMVEESKGSDHLAISAILEL